LKATVLPVLVGSLVLASPGGGRVSAQEASRAPGPTWSYAFDVGGFLAGNGKAIRQWLSANAYGATEPRRCTFDSLFRAICDDPVGYPKTSGSPLALMGSIRRSFSSRSAFELFISMEQSGQVTGRCDDLASPKDPRCSDRFMDVSFGGASFALLGEVSRGWVHVGAGPALLLANWDMTPSHLAGVWFDATVERDPIPFFIRGQYRYYTATGVEWIKGFSGFHPSSLFVGLGLRTHLNNGGS
jgi:hypothetical protein